MGACATKPGGLKVKGEAPLVVDDAAAPPVAAGDEKAKVDAVPVAAEVDQADVSRRRSLSELLKQQDAEANDEVEADQEPEKVVAVEPESAAGDARETMVSPQAPVQASVAAEQDDTADEPKDDPTGSGDAQEAAAAAAAAAEEEEKRVDPESVQVAVPAAPSSEESKVADDDAAAA